MSWQDYLQDEETITLPWISGRVIVSPTRRWSCQGRLPASPGWYRWTINSGRKTRLASMEPSESCPEILQQIQMGTIVGDSLFSDSDPFRPQRVYLLEEGLEPFTRISAGRVAEGQPLIFRSLEIPVGVEHEVFMAYEDRAENLNAIKGVTPSLAQAFRLENQRRIQIEAQRRAVEEQRRQEELRRQREEEAARLREKIGTCEIRRIVADVDFEAAARSAIEAGGAVFLGARKSYGNECIVRYKVGDERLECVCDRTTLNIIDAGVCLTDHDTGIRGDTLFSLETLPSVIREAIETDRLVVWRRGNA